MGKAWALLLAMGMVVASGAAQAPSPSVAARKTCTVNTEAPNPAETALDKGQYSQAEGMLRDLLAKDAANEAAHEELVRALLEQNKVDVAAKDAEAWVAASSPASSMALVAVGDVRYRQGVPREAMVQFQKATLADPCNARANYGTARVEELAGFNASAQKKIDMAHALHPTDDEINAAWIRTRPRKERLEKWAEYADKSDQISDEDRAKLKTDLAKESLYHASDCRMAASSPREATVQMVRATDDPTYTRAWGLDVQFNGKRRRLELDTGASGITISRAAAVFLGIDRQDASKAAGIGDDKLVKTAITHVASIKIGGMEFTNCRVEILEKWSVLDSDGLIGGDVFAESQLTLDFPKHELRVSPLPLRPGETEADRAKLEAEGDDAVFVPHDPYVAPDMAKWQRVYRVGHELLMPTGIVETKQAGDANAWKEKLFLLDTGAGGNMISPAAAREVTRLSRNGGMDVTGIQGEVSKVYESGKFTLLFAGLRLDSPSMTAFDMTSMSHGDGVEVSGMIGEPALFQLILHIDYRDNLVWCEHKQK